MNRLAKLKLWIISCSEKQSIRYVAFGGFNTCMCFSIYCACVLLGINYKLANATAWVIGVMMSYLFNSRYVFRRSHTHKQLAAFILQSILSLLVSMGILSLLVAVAHMGPIPASIIAIPFTVMVSYLVLKYVVFR